MIADSAAAVAAWIAEAVAPSTVRTGAPLSPPEHAEGPASVVCYLYDVAPRERLRGLRREPLQFDLTYLVLAQSPDPSAGHRLLDSVLSAAARRADVDIVDVPLAPELWLAFGAAPQPAIALRVVGRVERPEPAAPPVLEPLVIRGGGLRALVGRVMSSTGIPVAAAQVHCPGVAAPALTGSNGEFSFGAIPRQLPEAFEVLARRTRHVVSPQPDPSAQDAILLVIDPIGVMP